MSVMSHASLNYLRTTSTPTILHAGLCPLFLTAWATPVSVPPVPVLATKTSSFPEEGREVEVEVTIASMISGAVVSSCERAF